MQSLQDEIKRIFGDINFDDVALIAPDYACETCQDMGVVRYQVADIHDPRFGKLFACPNPNCPIRRQHLAERIERVGASSDWEDAYSGWTFDSFVACVTGRFEAMQGALSPETRKRGAFDGKRAAFAAARHWAEQVGQSFSLAEATQRVWQARYPGANADRVSHSIVLRGDVGLGKTGLAIAAVNLARANGQAVVFARIQSIVRRIQDTYSTASTETVEDVLRFYGEVPVLVIDEFGLEQYAPDRIEKIEEILRARDRKNLPFILTTNLSLDDMYRLWRPRIADVVAKAHQITIGGVKLRETAHREEVVW